MSEVHQYVMDVPSARRLTERIRLTAITVRDSVEKLQSLLDQARDGNVYIALGYPSWPAYIAEVMGEEPLRLSRDDRREIVHYLTGEGMSTRAIGSALGVSNQTVANDRAAGVKNLTPAGMPGRNAQRTDHVDLTTGEVLDEDPATSPTDAPEPKPKPLPPITGLDGKSYSPPAPRPTQAASAPPADRRRPLPDAFFDAVYDLGKKAEAIARLCDDDRFPHNAEKVAAKHRGDLLRARALIDQALEQLPGGTLP